MSGPAPGGVFQYTGDIVVFVIEQTGTYSITAVGATGGVSEADADGTVNAGGLGGEVSADFLLFEGETLDIAVGGAGAAGTSSGGDLLGGAGGGGGATYVTVVDGDTETPLEIAGGGAGGAFGASSTAAVGGVGTAGYGRGGAAGVKGDGAGGAGFNGNGGFSGGTPSLVPGEKWIPATGGQDFAIGLAGGSGSRLTVPADGDYTYGGHGGFGGGGGGGPSVGGGGGGYSGGAAGQGGASFAAATAIDPTFTAGVSTASEIIMVDLSCFLEHTRLLTPAGPAAVQTLAAGDLIVTAGGAVRAIRWVGQRQIDCRRHARPDRVWPIRIAAHAFGEGRPHRPLFLSPDHAVFAGGVLIPIRHLVNAGSIRQVERPAVAYFHVELDRHDLVLAEGLAVETLLPSGDHRAFGTGPPPAAVDPGFHSRAWEAHGYAPLVVTGPVVDAVRAWLATGTHFRHCEPPLGGEAIQREQPAFAVPPAGLLRPSGLAMTALDEA